MKEKIKRSLYLLFGIMFFLIGLIGVFIPILPTTPFMILAAACFAESSQRFHRMLLNNRWFGEDLRQWQENKTMKRSTKIRATWVIVFTFTLTILILWGEMLWQLVLILTASVLLYFLWRVPEKSETLELNE